MPESQPEINGSTSDGYHTFDELYGPDGQQVPWFND
jgi:hypothetical protein